jgi:hypothetical protein
MVYAVTQAILSLSILKLPHRYASLLLGGTGLALTIVALILASVLTHGLTIDGMASWLATTVVVWLVTTIGAITLPELLIRDGPARLTKYTPANGCTSIGSRRDSAYRPGPRSEQILISRPTRKGAVMGDTHDDPTDHARTTQPHAGIAMKDNFFWPGLILLVVAMVGLISTAATAAYRHYEWLSTTVLIAVLGAVAGALWLVMENRRVPHRGTVGRRAPR